MDLLIHLVSAFSPHPCFFTQGSLLLTTYTSSTMDLCLEYCSGQS